MYAGRERDVLFVNHDEIHVYEFIVSRTKDRAIKDGGKLAEPVSARNSEHKPRIELFKFAGQARHCGLDCCRQRPPESAIVGRRSTRFTCSQLGEPMSNKTWGNWELRVEIMCIEHSVNGYQISLDMGDVGGNGKPVRCFR